MWSIIVRRSQIVQKYNLEIPSFRSYILIMKLAEILTTEKNGFKKNYF